MKIPTFEGALFRGSYCNLFHILMIETSNRLDQALFNFLLNSFELYLLVIIVFDHEDMKQTIISRLVKSLNNRTVRSNIHVAFHKDT